MLLTVGLLRPTWGAEHDTVVTVGEDVFHAVLGTAQVDYLELAFSGSIVSGILPVSAHLIHPSTGADGAATIAAAILHAKNPSAVEHSRDVTVGQDDIPAAFRTDRLPRSALRVDT